MPTYNSESYSEKSIFSVLNQTYRNFFLVIVDDGSTDNTARIITGIWKDNKDRIIYHRNGVRIGSPLRSFVKGASLINADKMDVLITVDGDDWLYDVWVLEYMNEIYQDDGVWLTYGSFVSASGNLDNYCRPLNNTQEYRHGEWCTGHLRTLRKGLLDKIDRNDFLQKNGEFYNKYNDTAYMYPSIEMAGLNHIKFIDKVLYVYNDLNPLCSIYDFANAYQATADWDMREDIRNKPRYDEIKEL